MGFFNKVKSFFYDEEEIEEDVEEIIPVPKKKKTVSNVKIEEKINKKSEENDVENEISPSRIRRNFNFPIDVEGQETIVKRTQVKEEPVVEQKQIQRVEQQVKRAEPVRRPYTYSSTSINSVQQKKTVENKFKPTPVISPVFGILDSNYKADTKANDLEETKEFNITRKPSFDEIHKKAYGSPTKEIEEEFEKAKIEDKEENKGIFFNLDDNKAEDDIEESVVINKADALEDDDFDLEADIKIVYNDVNYDEESDEDIEVPKIKRGKRKKIVEVEVDDDEYDDDDSILNEDTDEDLFNLIDNMYNSDEEEDEE